MRKLVLGWMIVAAAETAAAGTDPRLEAAVLRYEDLDFESALRGLENVLASGELDAPEELRALAYLARVHAVLKHPVSAQDTFIKVLERDPSFEVSRRESPLIRDAFAAAARELAKRTGPPTTTRPAAAEPMSAPRPTPGRPRSAEEDLDASIAATPEEAPLVWPWIVGGAVVLSVGAILLGVFVSAESQPTPGTLGSGIWVLR